METKILFPGAMIGLSVCVITSAVAGGTIHVDRDATGPAQDGATWCTAYTDLQDALAAAAAGDEIRVAGGVYRPDRGTGQRTATFRLKDRVTVVGGYAGCGASNPDARNATVFPTTLSGDLNGDDGPDFANYSDNSYHVVTYDDSDAIGVVLDGFTVTSGNADGASAPRNQGGGIHIRYGTIPCLPGGPTIRNCIVEKNWGAHHGAINDHALSTTIEDCIIRDNYSGLEGGGLQIHSGAPTVRRCLFLNNTSGGEGGGAWSGSDTDPTCTGPSKPRFSDCTFDGNEAGKGGALFIDGSGPTIEDCTFRNNRAVFTPDPNTGFAAGIYNLNGVGVTVSDCTFTGNDTELYAGAMYNEGSSPLITGCTFVDNKLDPQSITLAGAMLNVLGSHPRIEDCVFRGNTAFYTAAVLNDTECNPTIVGCLFEDNYAPNGPGAVFNANNSNPFITNCVFRNNVGQFGGGMFNASNSSPTVVNSVFAGNSALVSGGAIGAHGADIGPLVNLTLYGNTANEFGGGVFLNLDASAQIDNSIIWGNSDSTGSGEDSQVAVLEAVLEMNHSCVEGWTGAFGGTGNTGSDPLFVDADGPDGTIGTDDDDLRLSDASPLIDAGDALALPQDVADLDDDGNLTEPTPLDLAGNPRVGGGAVDMGAYEYSDCNGNGVLDSVDISSGASEDCDGDGVPDECEEDCDGNGRADDCDPDADGDGVIDACDGCPTDPRKSEPGTCGCGVSDEDSDGDGVPDCNDTCPGFDDFVDTDGDGVADGCDVCAAGDDNLDCNHNGLADPCEVLDGLADDADGNGVPDECDIAPGVTADGCRALVVTAPYGSDPVALRVTAPDFPCFERFVTVDGSLGQTAVYRTGDSWGTLVIVDPEIVPSVEYAVEARFGDGTVSAWNLVTTAKWGDVVGMTLNLPPDGNVDFLDIAAVVERFKMKPNAPPLHRCDIHPATPDGRADFLDIGATVQGFKSRPYPHPGPTPCP